MPDETTAPVTTDTPDTQNTADSGQGTPALTENWEERYKSLQAEFTRTSQERAQLNELVQSFSDPEKASEAFSALGYEIIPPEVEQEPVEQFQDPVIAELAALKKQNEELSKQFGDLTAAQQKAQQEAAREAHFLQAQAALEQEHGRTFDEKELGVLFRLADTMPDDKGMPQVNEAFKLLESVFEADFENRVKAKREAAQAPPAGQPGAPQPDLSTPEGRLAYATERLNAISQT